MIERYNPFGRMLSLRQMMDRLLEDAFVMPGEGQVAPTGGAALNVYEEGDRFVVEAPLPGAKPEDIQVTVEGGMLTIRGETKADEERKERNYLIREHRQSSFARSLRLPDTVDPDGVQANFENGVLRLTFPRSKQAQPRRIPVTAAGGQAQPSGGQTDSGRPGASAQQRGAEQDRTVKAA
jgi:HSP20 family protein